MEKSKVNMDSFQALLKRFRTAKDTKTRHALQLRIDLEEQTIQKSVDMGKIVGELLVNTNDVKKSLPHNSVAVEFIKYPVVNYGIDNEISYRYGALILSNESEFPDFVDLCDEEALVKINKQVSSAYELNAQKAIHKLIWQPLIQYINDIQTIYFSPVDYLCITNLELVAEANYLNKSFVRVSSSRILCNVAQSHLSNKSATLFGGLCYDCSIPRNLSPNLTVNYLASLENDTIKRKGISYLPFSKEEVKNISYLSNKYGLQSVLYTDEKGSERDYRDLLNKSIPILHLSTHGFSL